MSKKIYIINQSGTNLYKIGFTRKKVSDRIKQLQTGSATDLIEVFQFETDFAPLIEKTMQRMFSFNNMKGEWFSFDISQLEDVRSKIISSHNNFQYLEDNKI